MNNLTTEQIRALDDNALRRLVAQLNGIKIRSNTSEEFDTEEEWYFIHEGIEIASVLATTMDEAWSLAWKQDLDTGNTPLPDWLYDLQAAVDLMPDDIDWKLRNYRKKTICATIEWSEGFGGSLEETPRGQEARAVTLAWINWKLSH